MTVLESPTAGGATVWPYARISVFPEKGAGVYWRNVSIIISQKKNPELLKYTWLRFFSGFVILQEKLLKSDNKNSQDFYCLGNCSYEFCITGLHWRHERHIHSAQSLPSPVWAKVDRQQVGGLQCPVEWTKLQVKSNFAIWPSLVLIQSRFSVLGKVRHLKDEV